MAELVTRHTLAGRRTLHGRLKHAVADARRHHDEDDPVVGAIVGQLKAAMATLDVQVLVRVHCMHRDRGCPEHLDVEVDVVDDRMSVPQRMLCGVHSYVPGEARAVPPAYQPVTVRPMTDTRTAVSSLAATQPQP